MTMMSLQRPPPGLQRQWRWSDDDERLMVQYFLG
ncbi:hypothetical protein A2U01_0108990, partial [Trifolium medium]|nr:hypothetical protein [Trifolium medium]